MIDKIRQDLVELADNEQSFERKRIYQIKE